MISKVIAHVCIPIRNGGVFFCSTTLLACATSGVFDLSHSNMCRMDSYSCLICISLKIKDFEYFFKCFFVTRESSVENVFYPCTLLLKLGYLGCYCLTSWIVCKFWDVSSLSDIGLAKILSQLIVCQLVLLMVSIAL